MNLKLMRTLHNNEVRVVFTEHTWMVVLFVEVDEHEDMSVLLVTHDVIIDFDEIKNVLSQTIFPGLSGSLWPRS